MGNRFLKDLLRLNIQVLKKLFSTHIEPVKHLFYHHPNGQESNGISLKTKIDWQQLSKIVLANSTKKKFTFAKNIALI
jgi:predicted SprT family Zn-dependent metalloprotease